MKLNTINHTLSLLLSFMVYFSIAPDSGVGAGIDSYYEYCLKAYILLGEEDYLTRFNQVNFIIVLAPPCKGGRY